MALFGVIIGCFVQPLGIILHQAKFWTAELSIPILLLAKTQRRKEFFYFLSVYFCAL